jgi:uncharacterized protein (DUF2252 family)
VLLAAAERPGRVIVAKAPRFVASSPRSDHSASVVHRTIEESEAIGKEARKRVPRSSHAAWSPPVDRADPVDLLESQAVTRVPELVPIRYGRMLTSPFAFYRGAALLMANDLATTPNTDLVVQACGDAHLSNFGLFGTPERRMVFDMNDFDETLAGPWEWDVKRLATSFEIASRTNGYSDSERTGIVRASVAAYRERMALFATMRNLDVWYSSIDVGALVDALKTYSSRRMLERFEAQVAKARTKDSMQAYEKLTHLVDGRPRIISDPPLIVPLDELLPPGADHDATAAEVERIFHGYRSTLLSDRRHILESFRIADVARKVVGVGSVGTRAWIILLLGKDGADPLFLQMKEAQPSVLGRYLPSTHTNEGERVVHGQRLMQAASDIFLGWLSVEGLDGVQRDFYMRQLRDWKGSLVVEAARPQGLLIYAQVCGATLARAHARSGDRFAIASYLGSASTFDDAIVEFAAAYADQNEQDHAALAAAVGQGRLEAVTGL